MVAIGSTAATLLLMSIINRREESHEKLDSRKIWFDTYDYIVVGSGAAGSVVASRLAEDTTKTVLLIEAGGPQPVMSDIPGMQSVLMSSQYDWNYPIVPQKRAHLGRVGNQVNVPRGKMFGGSGSLNSMNYYRENEHYFELWANVSGVPNWKWKHVLPFFLKTENNLDPKIVARDPDFHRRGGLISITSPELDQVLKEYLIAANQLGYRQTYSDGRQPFGANIMQKTIRDGVRQSTSLGFLEARNQPNLHIIGRSYVTKIRFNRQKRAIGLEFYKHKIHFTVKVRHEIIVSAGTIESPKLLMNSGIGPRDHLEDLNIPVISDLKVGHNLVSDSWLDFPFDIKDQTLVEKPVFDNNHFLEYYIDKRGPLTYKSSVVTCFKETAFPGFPGLSNGCFNSRIAEIGSDLEGLVKDFKLKDQWKQYYRPYLNRTYFELMIELRRPKKRGTVRLASTNPFDNPLIDSCELCEEQDVIDMIDTFELALEIYLSPHMRQFIEPFKKPIPGCRPCFFDNYFCRSYLRCIIKKNSGWICPSGTNRIGVDPENGAVVDQYLRVYGVSGLRVIDSSIIPISGDQTYAMTIMVAEYGSHLTKQFPLEDQ